MSAIKDAQGAIQQIEPQVEWYKAAAEAGLSLPQWVNQNFATDSQAYGTAYHQLLASEGIVLNSNRQFGIRSTRMDAMMGDRPAMQAGGLVKGSEFSSAALRTLFPSAILTAIEDKLVADLNMDALAFDKMVAIDDNIVGDKFERPLINYDKPSAARSQAIAQLAEPAAMLSITTSSVSRTIPSLSIGMLISDQARAATTLDLVSLAMSRQVAVERKLRAQEYVLQMLNGDPDLGAGAAVTLSSLGLTTTAAALDALAVTGITQLAWMKWLYRNSTKRVIDWVVTDITGAMAIENRSGKPTNVTENPSSPRIDSVIEVGNPTWKSSVKVFITNDANWPAKTIMGLDSRYAIHRVTSSTIAYQAVEQFVMRRAQALRVDFGEIAYRLYDDAFDTLTFA